MSSTTKAYELAKELYASIGVDTDKAIERLEKIPVSRRPATTPEEPPPSMS